MLNIEFLILANIVQAERAPQLAGDVYDVFRFITAYRDGIEDAPLQVYYTAAYFAPKRSLVRNYQSLLVLEGYILTQIADE